MKSGKPFDITRQIVFVRQPGKMHHCLSRAMFHVEHSFSFSKIWYCVIKFSNNLAIYFSDRINRMDWINFIL